MSLFAEFPSLSTSFSFPTFHVVLQDTSLSSESG